MNFYNFEIAVEKEPEDEGYLASTPTLPGCFSNGALWKKLGTTSVKPFSYIWPC